MGTSKLVKFVEVTIKFFFRSALKSTCIVRKLRRWCVWVGGGGGGGGGGTATFLSWFLFPQCGRGGGAVMEGAAKEAEVAHTYIIMSR